jgi:hypothetical protein
VLAKIRAKVFFTLFFTLSDLPGVLQRDQAFSLSCTGKIAWYLSPAPSGRNGRIRELTGIAAGGLAVRSPTEWGCTVRPVGKANLLVWRVNYQKGK